VTNRESRERAEDKICVSDEVFQQLVRENKMILVRESHSPGQWYGIMREEFEAAVRTGKIVVLDTTSQKTHRLFKRQFPGAVSVLMLPVKRHQVIGRNAHKIRQILTERIDERGVMTPLERERRLDRGMADLLKFVTQDFDMDVITEHKTTTDEIFGEHRLDQVRSVLTGMMKDGLFLSTRYLKYTMQVVLDQNNDDLINNRKD